MGSCMSCSKRNQCKAPGCNEALKNDFPRIPTHCNALGCTENHLKHYCEFCRNEDSDHFPQNCSKKNNVSKISADPSISDAIDEIISIFRKNYFVNLDVQKVNKSWFYDIEQILKDAKDGLDTPESREAFRNALGFLKSKTQWERIEEGNESLPDFINFLSLALKLAGKDSKALEDYSYNVDHLEKIYMGLYPSRKAKENSQKITDLAMSIFPEGIESKLDWKTFFKRFEENFASKNSISLTELVLENMKKLINDGQPEVKYSSFESFAEIVLFNCYDLDGDFFKYDKKIE